MQLKDVDATTEDAFLRCLHLETPASEDVMALRRRWYDRYRRAGLRAKVLVDDANTVVAMGQYVPIGISPFLGDDLAVILCMWVHGYDHHIGNVQGRGYGKQLLGGMEREIADAGFGGIVAWGMAFPYWNPVSWYLSRGYRKVDQRGQEVLVWKPLRGDATPPAFLPPGAPAVTGGDKPTLAVYLNAWCTGGCGVTHQARCAARHFGDRIAYVEFDTDGKGDLLRHGIDSGVFVNGAPYRRFEPPWTTETLIEDIERLLAGGGRRPDPSG
ncbi:MAG: hypothetical protein ACOC95_03045 [Planctomycetota bacterium]